MGLALILSAAGGVEEIGEEAITNATIQVIVGAIMPIMTMALATAAFGNEVEDRTLSYLVLKPLPRVRIVLPKLLASIAVGGPLLVASGIAATVIGLDVGIRAALAVGVALLAGVVAYASLFTFAGLITRSALAFALIYVMMWEGLLSSLLSGVRYLSVRGYTLAVIRGIDGQSFESLSEEVIEFPAAIGGLAIVTVVSFWLTVYRLRQMDVP